MRTLRQILIQKDLKEGISIANYKKEDDYVDAIFMLEKPQADKNVMASPEAELEKQYKFRIPRDKLGNIIDQIKSTPGVIIQSKPEQKSAKGKAPEKQMYYTPDDKKDKKLEQPKVFPEIP